MHPHPYDQFNYSDGTSELREPFIVEGNKELTGSFIGSICVHAGASFEIPAGSEHIGSLTFHPGSTGAIRGRHVGTVKIMPHAQVRIWGWQEGTVQLHGAGEFTLMDSGTLTGTVQHL